MLLQSVSLSILSHQVLIFDNLFVLHSFSLVTWAERGQWPAGVAAIPVAPPVDALNPHTPYTYTTQIVMLDLCFLSIVSLNGLGRAFADLAKLTRADGSTPRIRFMYLICGLFSIFSGFFGGPPIVISPETGKIIMSHD